MKKKIIFTLIFLIISSISIALGDYIIANLHINDFSDDISVETTENKNDYKKIELVDNDNNLLKKMYIKTGDKLEIDDFPLDYQSASYEWIDTSTNQPKFSLAQNSFSEGLVVDKEYTLKANDIGSSATQTTPNSDNFKPVEGENKGDSTVNVDTGSVAINQGNNKGSVISMEEPILKEVDFDLNFKTATEDGPESGGQSIKQDLGDTGATQHSSDKTIGLEDPNSPEDIYKPKAGSTSNSSNPLVTRLKLECDTYLIGESENSQAWLGVGARTGFYGASGWSQFSYQGFINGSYCELDLNGHKLFIGNYATLELWGSLIDSSEEKNGEVIVENGGTVKSTFVIEDHYHETSIPIAYAYGDAPFKMYRMPYLNAPLKVKNGGTLKGYLRLDFGGDKNANYGDMELNIIGNGGDFMFDTSLCDSDSYIFRKPLWDDYWSPSADKDTINNETETVQSIVYEKFSYEIYNCKNLSVNTPTLSNIEYVIADLGPFGQIKATFSFNWDRCDFFIPPYFNIYLHNSNATIKNNFVFLPGSYLYIDENSSLTLSANGFDSGDLANLGTAIGLVPDKLKITASYQAVGGLMFLNEKPYWKDSWKGWADGNNQDSQPPEIFDDTTNFWSYMNKNYLAKADIYGQILFDNNANLVKEKYHLGGEINFFNNANFLNINNSNVELYNSIFIGTSCHFDTTTPYFNADTFSVLPLISNGNVLTDVSSQTLGLRNNYSSEKYIFDNTTGLITAENGAKYAYTYCDNNGLYNNWSDSLNKAQYDNYNESEYKEDEDDLRAKFYPCTINDDNSVNIQIPMSKGDGGTYKFIYFRGSFFRFENGTVDIFKFKGPNPKSNNNGWNDSYLVEVEYKDVGNYYGHSAWMVK